MAKDSKSFFGRISAANVMPDGMLSEISYGDYALMMALKDKPEDEKNNHKKLH